MIKRMLRAIGMMPAQKAEVNTKEIKAVKKPDPLPRLKLREGNSIFEDAMEKAHAKIDDKTARKEAKKKRRTARKVVRDMRGVRPNGHIAP
jgi:hypothetical protein